MPNAIRIHATGGPEQLRFEPVPEQAPGPGQLLLRQTAIGVNFIDVYQRSGLYPVPSLPHVLGGESVGVVAAVGQGVTGVRAGDRVGCATSPSGAYAERRVIAADLAVPLPAWLDDARAAALLLKGMTAECLARRVVALAAGQRTLVHAAAGGVGQLLCQWLRALDVEVIGTVGSDAKAEVARRNGCAHTIVYAREDFAARVRELTAGQGVHVVYDSVGKATLPRSLDCLRRRGTLVAFGNSSGRPDPVDPLLLAQKGSLYLTRPTLFDYVRTRDELLQSAQALFDVVQRGVVAVHIDRELPLREAAAAHRALESRATTGSIVLRP